MAKKVEATEQLVPRISVQPVNIVDEMKYSFIEYSMSVITSRALPDVRDGLKPVHRRILFAMHKMGLTAGAKFRKSAKIVGDVLGNYHPHGDSAVYESMVNMAQPFSYRYPLVTGQGNFGSVDGDRAAAQRYTEARMSPVSMEYLRDIEKDTVDFVDNYDNTIKEPSVLPVMVPGLLLNGVLGIAVGMATNIPPHNLTEVLDAAIALSKNSKLTVADLMEYIQGPDFPLGGMVFNKAKMLEAYKTGRGGVVTRGDANIEEIKGGREQIVITSIPFRVNRSNLIIKIADLVKEKKIKGIKGLRDESAEDTRIVVEMKTGIDANRVLNLLYKYTDLQTSFNFNMTALVDGVPEIVSLKDLLSHFLDHRLEVVRRRTEFDLKKAQARAHILEGLKKALDHIDEIIKLIRASEDVATAKAALIKKFKFTDIQAQAILDMRLQKLAGLERKKIEDELKEKLAFIAECEALLASETKMKKVIQTELAAIKDKYGDERRTRVIASAVGKMKDEDLIPDIEAIIMATEDGYIKRVSPSEYKKQGRGGAGVSGMSTKDDDQVKYLLSCSTKDALLFFTNQGRVYSLTAYEIPEQKRGTRGKALANFVTLQKDEEVTAIVPFSKKDVDDNATYILVTRQGNVKRLDASAFVGVRRNGLLIMGLKGDDELFGAFMADIAHDVMLCTEQGQAIRFKGEDVRVMGRGAGGVRGMKLSKGDVITSAFVIENPEANILFLSLYGSGKQTAVSEFKTQGRGGSGIKAMAITEKTGELAKAFVIDNQDAEILLMSANSVIIRTGVKGIATQGRSTQGVRVMKLKEGDVIATATIV